MKKTFFAALLLAAMLWACKHESIADDFFVEPPAQQDTTFLGMEPNSMKALRNGKEWESHEMRVLSGGDSVKQILISHSITNEGLNNAFDIYDIPITPGRYALIKFPFNYWQGTPFAVMGWIYDQDQIIGYLSNDSLDTSGYVEVVSFDPETCIVKGKFQMQMTGIVANFPSFWDPEKTIVNPTVLTDGKFVVKIPE